MSTRPAAPHACDGACADTGDLRSLMAAFPTGVAVVAAADPAGEPIGMTCSSLCSVALDPPTLLVCLREHGPTAAAVLASGSFTVNLLDDRARDVAELFASGAADRFAHVRWRPGAAGPHLVADAHSTADCRVDRRYTVGDHVVVLGEVERVTVRREPRPLLYGMRRFKTWEGAGPPADPAGRLAARTHATTDNTEN
ncbi:flavin reductase family protein [Glycomyces terrestris]|uniref:Flavin reductase n=1 Tax=Glycomyces terrestris TaxID=2493553 RepID=A0A426V0V4_9ACTN|nr:flavin reductase family protein [Glycomyces terrestris]RRS00521.1 flavin reductase [Glycomyces terrestris]